MLMTGIGFFAVPANENPAFAHEINFVDIKGLNDLAHDCKLRLLALIDLYRAAQKMGSLDQPIIHRRISEEWASYRLVRSEANGLTHEYLRRLKQSTYRASPPHTEKDCRVAA